MSEAIEAYNSITVTPEFKERERLYEKARHDEASALYYAEQKKSLEIAKKLLDMDISINKIIEATGLTLKEVEVL